MIPRLDCSQCPGARSSAFACLKPAQRAHLARAAVPHDYQQGQTIFHQGTPALAVYCVRSGLVKLAAQFNHGESVVVAARGTGDLFGYRAVLAGIPYEVSAETIEPSVVCTIPREDFMAVLDGSHQLSLQLLKRLAWEYHLGEERLVERAGEPVVRRTARFLLKLSGGAGLPPGSGGGVLVPTRRRDLALLLGTTPETLSRTLHDLACRKLVEVDRKEVRVLDLARLQRLAE